VGWRFGVDVEGDVAAVQHIRQANARLPEALNRRNPAAIRPDGPVPERGQVAVQPVAPGDKRHPAVILDQADLPARRRQPEVGVVNPEQ